MSIAHNQGDGDAMTLIETALSEWGEAERIGAAFNPRIAEYLATCGLGPSDEETWCAAFLTWCAIRSGVAAPPRPAVARSWLTVGQPVTNPSVGDIAVLRRGEPWQAHVGLFVRKDGDAVRILGGNQGKHVGIEAFRAGDVVGYRSLRRGDLV